MATEQPSSLLPALTPLSVLRIIWKRKYLIGLVWVLISAATYLVVKRLPSVYKAEAVVLVDSQKIPDRYVSPTVVSDVQDRLATISLQILSNEQLKQIIQRFDLYKEQRQTVPMEKIFEIMRKDIEVQPERAWTGRTPSFRVGFQGPNPVVTAQVANWIAQLYVRENTRDREAQAIGTSQFIDSQLKEAKQKLDQLEAAVSQYKTRHNGELPEQEGSLNASLNRLQVELEANRDALNRAQQAKMTVQDALSVAEDNARIQERQLRLAASVASGETGAPGTPAQTPATRVEQLQTELAGYLARGYTDEHPDVKRVRAELEEAKKLQAKTPAAIPAKPGARSSQDADRILDSPEMLQMRARIASLNSQLAVANDELKNREAEQRRIMSDIATYQSRIGSLPIREQEMAQLTRDYQFSKSNYQSLLDKKINATMATDMELRQKSERFTLADPALVPRSPFKPKRLLLDIGGAIFGLIFGVALAFGRELHQGVLLGEWELPAGVPVLGRLPYIRIAPNALLGSIQSGEPGVPHEETGAFESPPQLSSS